MPRLSDSQGNIGFTKSLLLVGALLTILVAPAALAQEPEGEAAPTGETSKVKSLFKDFLHFARLGKFTEAQAFGTQLLEHPNLDPLALLEVADQDKQAVPTLITLIGQTSLRDTAQQILDQIRKGEYLQRQNVGRIQDNIQRLGGPPQMEFMAIQRLKDSGEYAIPHMIDALTDPSREKLWPRVIRALPQIGKPAVSPLVAALAMDNEDVRRNIVWALGEIGYPQAVPYLLKLLTESDLPAETRDVVREAIVRIEQTSDRAQPESAVAAFLNLSNQYYEAHGSVKADPRLPTANVWYWENGRLVAKQVPTEIHGPVMAMRTSEEALLLKPDTPPAIALWLAANFRREARLGMDVESTDVDAGADADPAHGADFPRSIYFARSAGPEYCHMVLARAMADQDKPVALGAIAALDVIAGAASLIGSEDVKQPLIQALQFPDAEVRIKAGIALARALPKSEFRGMDVIPNVLSDALILEGAPQYVLASGNPETINRVSGELRGLGIEAVAEASFYAAMDRARTELTDIDGFVLATDLESPPVTSAVPELRRESRFSRVPVVILVAEDQEYRAEPLVGQFEGVAGMPQNASGAEIQTKLQDMARETGGGRMDREMSLDLAMRAAEALRLVAVDGQTVINASATVPALIQALNSGEEQLQIQAARTLAMIPSSDGQQAIAVIALNEDNGDALRQAAFDALAESARRHGNMLTPDQVTGVVKAARETEALDMRTSASQALGALNLQTNQASEIIRGYHRG